MRQFRAPAPEMIQAKWHGGSQTPGLIVMHSMVTPCKEGMADAVGHMFATEATPTSAHYGVDPGAVRQYVGDHTVAYHCGYNDDSIGIEMADYPGPVPNEKPGTARWKAAKRSWRWVRPEQRKMLRNAAGLAAELCLAYDIPPVFCGAKRLLAWDRSGHRASQGGITTHALMSSTFHKSTHWDPGFWPRRWFMRLVRAEVKRQRKAANNTIKE